MRTCLALGKLYPLVFVWCLSFILAHAYQPLLAVSTTSLCPLNFSLLDALVSLGVEARSSKNSIYRCAGYVQALHFVMVEYVAQTGRFWVPSTSADACWDSLDKKLGSLGRHVNVRTECNFTTASLAQGSDKCGHITSTRILESVVPPNVLSDISVKCANASMDWLSSCSVCLKTIVEATYSFLHDGNSTCNVICCRDLLQIYGVSSMNSSALRAGAAACMWNLMFRTAHKATRSKLIFGSAGATVMLVLTLGLLSSFYVRHRMRRTAKSKQELSDSVEKLAKSNSTLTWYTFDELKDATDNFSASNLLGRGGFGSVYKGVLAVGTEIAVKKFKDCTHAGDDEFFHEVEVISSVKHRNLVTLRGCCVGKSDPRGHQRIIVYDYMVNGSLHDHLFCRNTALDWPKRQNIAIGIVRGLAYLHQEVQPSIIHRDIKSSNILLDGQWNARVADFGLAKFTLEGTTHVTTRVAGTHGYVAPEYVLYGKLNEKSDVYSFGILLLELLTRQKTVSLSTTSGEPLLIADWAWPFIKEGNIKDVLDPLMDNLCPVEVLEKYVRIACLCAHPQVSFRPSIDQVLKLMETDEPLLSVPDRPPPYTIAMHDLEKSIGASGDLSSSVGFRSFSSSSSIAR